MKMNFIDISVVEVANGVEKIFPFSFEQNELKFICNEYKEHVIVTVKHNNEMVKGKE
jgi:hypothetical protein